MPRTRLVAATVTMTSPVSAASEVYLGHWVPKHDAAIWAARLKTLISNPSTSATTSSTASGTVYIRELSKQGLPYLPTIQASTVSAGSIVAIGTVTNQTGVGTNTNALLFPVLASAAFGGISTSTASSPLIYNHNIYATSSATGVVAPTMPVTDYGFLFTFLKTTSASTDTVVLNISIEGEIVMNNER